MREAVVRLPDGIELAYQTIGDRQARPLLLVMGLGGPLNWWDEALCRRFAERDFFVIRYDNRDIGRSSRVERPARRSQVLRAFLGDRTQAVYSMADLANDALGLLDHLEIDAAHLCGASMGGMIAQTVAVDQPHRVRSLVSAMSTTGRRTVGWQDPRLFPLLLAPQARSKEEYVRASQRVWRLIGSPAYPMPKDEIGARAAETWERGVSAAGTLRQMLAVLTQPDRTSALRTLDIPTLVVHGLSDRLVHSSGGRATARAIPDAELLLVPGMGHDLPRELYDLFVDAVDRTARRADAKTTPSERQASPVTSSSSSSASSR